MSRVGFCGGGLIFESGTASEIQSFFDALEVVSESSQNEMDWSLVLDRLYKRYVYFDDIDQTEEIMAYCEVRLIKDGDDEESNLFVKYFRHLNSCLAEARAVYQTFGEYIPIKVSVVDLPWYVLENQRPLEEYAQLDGEPFWMREYTKEDVDRLSNL